MNTRASRGLAGLCLFVALPFAAKADLANVRTCVDDNTPRLSTVQQIALDVRKGDRPGFEASFTLFWRRVSGKERRILLRFREPEDLKDAALLVTDVDAQKPRVHIYLPAFGRARAISSRGELEAFLGRANLGISELEILVDPLGSYGGKLLPDPEPVEGRATWAVEQLSNGDADVRYQRTLTFIDREYCIPTRAEFYDGDGELAKVLEVDAAAVKRVESSWIPTALVFRDRLRQKDTHIRTEEIEVDVPFSPALLTAKALHRKGK